jgi:hypothetical protein
VYLTVSDFARSALAPHTVKVAFDSSSFLDRLTHHVHILELNDEIYRLKQSAARRKRAPRPSDETDVAEIQTGKINPATESRSAPAARRKPSPPEGTGEAALYDQNKMAYFYSVPLARFCSAVDS